ncbi:unnamed protein product, partial [Nesidiocoris tenuis]
MMSTSGAQYHLVSGDSDSCDSTGARRKTLKPISKMKKQKSHRTHFVEQDEPCVNWSKLGLSVGIFSTSFLLVWVVVLTLLTTELFKRTVDLQRSLTRISAQTDELPAQILKCQTFSETLQKNQTQMASEVTAVNQKLSNVTSAFSKLDKNLLVMEEQLRTVAMLASVPSQLLSLSSSVAGLGSEVEDLKMAFARFRDVSDKRNVEFESWKSRMPTMNETFRAHFFGNSSKFGIRSHELESLVDEIRRNVSSEMATLNESLAQQLRYQIQDQKEDHKLIMSLQESLANLSSQILSLEGNLRSYLENYNNLELNILDVKEQLRAKSSATTIAPEGVRQIFTTKSAKPSTVGMES